jgi:hypothetical protein
LTPAGIEFVQANKERLEEFAHVGEVKEHRQKSLKQLRRLRSHLLFQRFEREEEEFSPSLGEMADLLRCRVDAESSVWEKRFDQLQRLGAAANEPKVAQFAEQCESAYRDQQ